MSLSVEDKLVGTIVLNLEDTVLGMNEITVLEHLSEEEAVLEVQEGATIGSINVRDLGESGAGSGRGVDGQETLPRPVPVGLVTGSTVSVVEGLNDFGAENVVRVGDVETSALVEIGLVGWDGGVVGVCLGVVGDPSEALGTDSSQGAVIGVVAAVNEGEAEVDVLLLLKNETTEDEVPTVEACNCSTISRVPPKNIGIIRTMLRHVKEVSVVEHGHESQVWSRGRVASQVGDARVGSQHPAILVLSEAR